MTLVPEPLKGPAKRHYRLPAGNTTRSSLGPARPGPGKPNEAEFAAWPPP